MTSSFVGAAEQSAGNLSNTVVANIGSAETRVTSLMSPQQAAALAPSIFSTGPQDELVTRDIYGVVQGNPINNVDRLVGNNNADLISAFSSADSTIDGLAGLLSVNARGISLNPTALAQRVSRALVGFSGTYARPCVATLNAAIRQSGLARNQYPLLSTSVGGAISRINTNDINGAQCLINTISTITGDPSIASYMDVDASSALMSVVMREAITMGVSGAVEALVGSATNSEVAANALHANTSYAIQRCDISTVNTIVTALGSGYVSSQVPNAAGQMLSTYRFPAGTDASQYATLYTSLVTTLDTVDPGWGTTMRNGVPVSDLTPFVTMSADAKTLFLSQNAYPVQLIIAPLYPSRGLIDQAKSQYPYMLVTAPSSKYVVTNPATTGV